MTEFRGIYYSQLFSESNTRINVKPRKLSTVFCINESKLVGPKLIEPEKSGRSEETDNLYFALRFFLRLGRCLGIIPLSGLFRNKSEGLTFRWKSFAVGQSIISLLALSVNAAVGFFNLFRSTKHTASDVASQSASAIFYSLGFFIYAHFLRNAEAFIQLFVQWRQQKKLHFSSPAGDVKLLRHTNSIATILLISAVLENQLLFLLQSQVIRYPNEDADPGSLFEVYYRRSHMEWAKFFSGTSVTAFWMGIIVFITNKLTLYAWNFADILIILLSRALYYKFKMLNAAAASALLSDQVSNDPQQWKYLTYDFKVLCDLLHTFAKFLSPLVFFSFAVNTFFICIQIKLGLTPASNTNPVMAMYAIWSFLHLILRVFLVSLSAARINENIEATRLLFQLCPTEVYGLEIQRTDMRIATTQIGLTGFGCFVITKPFLLTVVGVVFTLEIVLLQTV